MGGEGRTVQLNPLAFLVFDNLLFFVIIFEAGAAGLLGPEPHAVGRRHEAEEAGQDYLLGSVH